MLCTGHFPILTAHLRHVLHTGFARARGRFRPMGEPKAKAVRPRLEAPPLVEIAQVHGQIQCICLTSRTDFQRDHNIINAKKAKTQNSSRNSKSSVPRRSCTRAEYKKVRGWSCPVSRATPAPYNPGVARLGRLWVQLLITVLKICNPKSFT